MCVHVCVHVRARMHVNVHCVCVRACVCVCCGAIGQLVKSHLIECLLRTLKGHKFKSQ